MFDRPICMEDYPLSQIDFERRFPDEASCAEYIVTVRWPEGPRCPNCQGSKFWNYGTTLKCAGCRKNLRILSGTLFQDTHLPLMDWFRAMWFVVSQKYGTNAMGLERSLGFHYSTSWHILHKLRRAMVRQGREPLKDTVEVDEAFIGGLSEGSPGRKLTDAKALVVIAVELEGKAIGRVRMKQLPSSSGENLLGFIKRCVQKGTNVITDGWRGYSKLEENGCPHEVRPMNKDKTALPHVHTVISLLKRWLLGTYQGAVSPEYLDYYLDEYSFRFNRRKSKNRGKLFYRLVEQALQTPPVTYEDIVKSQKKVRQDTPVNEADINEDSPTVEQYSCQSQHPGIIGLFLTQILCQNQNSSWC